MKTFYLTDIPKTEWVRIDEFTNTITVRVRHDNNFIGWKDAYVWLDLDLNNIVTGIYCSNTMYDNRVFEEMGIKVGDKFIYNEVKL